ncbi:unnamed protein product [Rotaria sordida]|uniref:Uncharacterized protein n=1 Tax=Rotaria sordida TaxID=392033 RepID=A0A815YJG7_9BILA|nr:unnamed protein product [Rotaria sordida]CAF1570545.1 unnamed protein product [Rotaria sordida]
MSTGDRVYGPGQKFILPHGGVPECTEQQLHEVGYIRPDPVYPSHPINPNLGQRTYQGPAPVYTSNITIRCLEPPPLPPGKLTIIEKRPRAPSPPSPKHVHGPLPERSRTPPPLILRQRPPSPPHSTDAICCVRLPPPPPPPRQRINHIYGPCPPKPPNIIVERWLPYKRSPPRDYVVIRAPPYNPIPVQNLIIKHTYPAARIEHEIRKYPQPIRTNPEYYIQQHGHTLLGEQALQETLFSVLSQQRAGQHILQRLQAIFRVPCDQNHERIDSYKFIGSWGTENIPTTTEIHSIGIGSMTSHPDNFSPTAALCY